MHNQSKSARSERGGQGVADPLDEDLAGLVAGARAGEESAWGALYQRFTPMLRGMARQARLGEHEADDVVQQTWLKAVEHIAALRDAQALPGWLATTCRRETLRALGRRGRCVPVDVSGSFDGSRPLVQAGTRTDPAARVEERELVDRVRRAVSVLPAHQARLLRGLLGLYGGHGSYGELSELLSMPIGSIGPTRLRAFRRLRREPLLQGL